MRSGIIVLVVALASYTLARLISTQIESITLAPLQAAIFAAVGAFGALSITGNFK